MQIKQCWFNTSFPQKEDACVWIWMQELQVNQCILTSLTCFHMHPPVCTYVSLYHVKNRNIRSPHSSSACLPDLKTCFCWKTRTWKSWRPIIVTKYDALGRMEYSWYSSGRIVSVIPEWNLYKSECRSNASSYAHNSPIWEDKLAQKGWLSCPNVNYPKKPERFNSVDLFVQIVSCLCFSFHIHSSFKW